MKTFLNYLLILYSQQTHFISKVIFIMNMELLIAFVALGVAFWQLKLQRDEIRTESRISSLLHVDQLLTNRILFLEKIIEDKKFLNLPWYHIAQSINEEIKPVRNDINNTLLDEIKTHLPNHVTIKDLKYSLGILSKSNSETYKYNYSENIAPSVVESSCKEA